jgi:hypothetical protein
VATTGRAASIFDFLLRLTFFAAAPFLLVFVAAVFPVTGAIAQIGLALGVFFAGEAVRNLARRSRVAAFLLSTQLQFEAYYRAHPPRPFLYYVFYPLLFPYWVAVRHAREEFLLFKGYTLASFVLLLASLGLQFWRSFPPELGLADFAPIALGTFLVEAVVVLMFLAPIVTSAVHYHLQRAPKRLAVLLAVGLVSVSLAVWRLELRRDPIVSFATRIRVTLRTAAKPQAAQKAQETALRAAWKVLPKELTEVEHDGKIEGNALDVVHDSLQPFYRADEAHAFDLWYTKSGKTAVMVVYFEARPGHDPIWLAMYGTGAIARDTKYLPPNAFKAMMKATE